MANQKIANYFFPHLRRGLGAGLDPGAGSGEKRALIDVKFKVKATDKDGNEVDTDISQKAALYGPGDVLGFDHKRMIWRVHPTPDDGNFVANNIPFVEFKEPDFPWRYSAAQTAGHWIPWLSLIVLKMPDTGEVGEFEFDKKQTHNLPPKIKLKAGAVLPDLSASWRWAHVYYNDSEGIGGKDMQAKIKAKPWRAISRLFCARRLKAGTKYCAFMVPTYLLGVEAALGSEKPETSRADLSWKFENEQIKNKPEEIPYYFHWEFRTGLRGDFEEMVRQIKPNPVKNLGGKEIDISNPGYGFKSEGRNIIEIDGALQSSDQNDHDSNPLKWREVGQLVKLLNKAEVTVTNDGQTKTKRRVVPPIYGRWINRQSDRDEVKVNYVYRDIKWLEMLNLDIRHRIAAGLGVQYVKENQEELMNEAWTQIDRVLKETRQRNLDRAGREFTTNIHRRLEELKNADPDAYISFMEPVTTKVKYVGPQAINVTTGAVSGLPIFNPSPGGLPSTSLGGATLPSSALYNPPTLKGFGNLNGPLTIKANLQLSNVSNARFNPKLRKYQGRKFGGTFKSGNIGDWQTNINAPGNFGSHRLATSSRKVNTDATPQPTVIPVDLSAFSSKISEKINPKLGGNMWANRVIESEKLPNWLQRKSSIRVKQEEKRDPLSPPMAYPEFHAPMYKYLLALSEEYFLPGLDQVPQNTVSALVTNRKFIEAFLVGLNHEFASELRWRGYPTDLRGSYFRKFWDTTIYSMDDKEKAEFKISPFAKLLLEKTGKTWPIIEQAYYTAPNRGDADAYEEAVMQWLKENNKNKNIADLTEQEKQQFEASDIGKKLLDESSLDLSEIETAYHTKLLAEAYEEAIESWLLTRELDKDIAPLHTWREGMKLGTFTVRGVIADAYEEAANQWLKKKGKNKKAADLTAREKQQFKAEAGEQLLFELALDKEWWDEIEDIYEKQKNTEQDDNELVLMVRAELLQKFPNTLIYLMKGKYETVEEDEVMVQKKLPDWSDTNTMYPIFEAELPPDIVCLGFEISEDQAKGIVKQPNGTNTKEAGYFIVFEERVSKQRYGLDVTTDYSGVSGDEEKVQEDLELLELNVSWENFGSEPVEESEPVEGYLDNDEPLFKVGDATAGDAIRAKWRGSAPYIAKIFTQKQVRVVVDLEKLMP